MKAGRTIERLILSIRDQRVILAGDLAAVYGVETRRLNEQVRRNAGRFPGDHRDVALFQPRDDGVVEAGGAFVYSAAVPREKAQKRSVERMLDTVFRGSAEGLVLTLLQSRGLSKDEAARIREMIRQAEGRS